MSSIGQAHAEHGRAGAAVHSALVLWRFSRPHTIAGTVISVLALYVIARELGYDASAFSLAGTLTAACLVNLAIVGLNQVEDVEIDRINKPGLPLPASDLEIRTATTIVWGAGAVALALAITQGAIELVAVGAALLIGHAYSAPPLHLKRFPVAAVASITVVRSLAVNLGVFGHFAGSLDEVPAVVWALTAFTVPFAAAIAVLKDVPDVEGDRAFRIRTFSVRFGQRAMFRLAVGWLLVAFAAMAVAGAALGSDVHVAVFSAGQVAMGLLLAFWARGAQPESPRAFTVFYMRVWLLFLCEYALAAAAVAL